MGEEGGEKLRIELGLIAGEIRCKALIIKEVLKNNLDTCAPADLTSMRKSMEFQNHAVRKQQKRKMKQCVQNHDSS